MHMISTLRLRSAIDRFHPYPPGLLHCSGTISSIGELNQTNKINELHQSHTNQWFNDETKLDANIKRIPYVLIFLTVARSLKMRVDPGDENLIFSHGQVNASIIFFGMQ